MNDLERELLVYLPFVVMAGMLIVIARLPVRPARRTSGPQLFVGLASAVVGLVSLGFQTHRHPVSTSLSMLAFVPFALMLLLLIFVLRQAKRARCPTTPPTSPTVVRTRRRKS